MHLIPIPTHTHSPKWGCADWCISQRGRKCKCIRSKLERRNMQFNQVEFCLLHYWLIKEKPSWSKILERAHSVILWELDQSERNWASKSIRLSFEKIYNSTINSPSIRLIVRLKLFITTGFVHFDAIWHHPDPDTLLVIIRKSKNKTLAFAVWEKGLCGFCGCRWMKSSTFSASTGVGIFFKKFRLYSNPKIGSYSRLHD